MKHYIPFGFAILVALAASSPVAGANTIYQIAFESFDFSSATGGPYYLDFQFTGTGGNTVGISGFDFGGGSATPGTSTTIDDASGDLTSSVTLTDVNFFYNEFYQQFTPGTSLSFVVDLTDLDSTPPDGFAFSILDNSLFSIPTTDPADTLVTVDLGSSPTINLFETETGSGEPVIGSATLLPEPSTLVLLGAGMIGVASLLLRKRLLGGALLAALVVFPASAQNCQTFFQPNGSPITSGFSDPASVAIADLDGDGIPDLAVADSLTHSVSLWKGSGNGQFTLFSKSPITLPPGTSGPYVIATGDLNGDKKIDLIVVVKEAFYVYLGQGGGGFGPPTVYMPLNNGQIPVLGPLFVADVNGDNAPDVIVGSEGGLSGTVPYVFLNSNDGTGTLNQTTLPNGSLNFFTLADMNNDGYPDLIGATTSGTLQVLLNDHTGVFTAATSTYTLTAYDGPNFAVIAAADFTGDNQIDIAVVGSSSGKIALWILAGDGHGGFTTPAATPQVLQSLVTLGVRAPTLGNAVNVNLVAADFDGDGIVDLAFATVQQVANGQGVLVALKGTGGGGFALYSGTPLALTGISPSQIASADLNADGRPDLIATSTGMGAGLNVFLEPSQIPSIGITSSANPGVTGTPLTLTAIIGGGSICALPTGTVRFLDNGSSLGEATIVNGAAHLPVNTGLPNGIHTVTALYGGDMFYVPAGAQYVQFIGGSSCAANITAQVKFTPGAFVYNRATQQFVQEVSVTNTGSSPITGPISLALDSLGSNATAVSPGGFTSCATPVQSPYFDLGICPGGSLAPGNSIQVAIEFSDPTLKSISYIPRVLAGLAVR